MAESIAAIGLAGNIIQFISFTFVLVSKSREIYYSASGAADEIVDLEIIAQDIEILCDEFRLREGLDDWRLVDMANRCKAVAEELQDAISDLQSGIKGKESRIENTKWKSFRTALRSVWGKKRVEELKSRLESLRDQVTMQLISYTKYNQVKIMEKMERWSEANTQENYSVTEDIRSLNSQLQVTHKQLSDIGNKIEGHWKRLSEHFTPIVAEVQRVSKCHTLIQSLRYESMEVREDAIQQAHVATYNWIFNTEEFPSSYDHPNVNYVKWLQKGAGVYWVTGKAGSGKSTLMKHIYHHEETMRHLQIWSGPTRLVKASFYFWKSGRDIQKSLRGLLQTLLFHVLRACPDLVPILFIEKWNNEDPEGIRSTAYWAIADLQKAISRLGSQSSATANFYFHVDGLDEYSGDSWEVIDTLITLSCPNIKLCVSSRPWNIFQDVFGRSNSRVLQMHLLTRGDIELYARDNLIPYIRHTELEPSLFYELVRDIGDRAQGMFLWVRLVVNSLREGLINEDPVSLIQKRLRAIPSDLEKSFEHILQSVEEIYRPRMAITFLATLEATSPLKIIHYCFLEQEDTEFSLSLPSERWEQPQVERTVAQTLRRLNGRYKGLLEPVTTRNPHFYTSVDFLHLTLKDFMATERMNNMLKSWAAKDLNFFTALSFALVATVKFVQDCPSPAELSQAIQCASRGAIEMDDTAHYFATLDQVELSCRRPLPCPRCRLNCFVLQIAIATGNTDYVRYRLQNSASGDLDLDWILKYALFCPVRSRNEFSTEICQGLNHYGTFNEFTLCSECSFEDADKASASPQMIELILWHQGNKWQIGLDFFKRLAMHILQFAWLWEGLWLSPTKP